MWMIFLRAKSCKQRQHPATIEWIDLVHLSMDYYIAAAKSLQSCPTLCDPIDDSPPGSPVPRILQARTLEQVAISFSNAWKWKVKVKSLSCVRLLATPWTTSPPGSSVHGIFQAVLEWGAIAFFNYIAVKVIQWHTYEWMNPIPHIK